MMIRRRRTCSHGWRRYEESEFCITTILEKTFLCRHTFVSFFCFILVRAECSRGDREDGEGGG